MIGKRNLGKAVVLGLLLSTGMYGAVWAAEVTTSEFLSGKYANGNAIEGVIIDTDKISVNQSITVNGVTMPADQNQNFIANKEISVDKNVDLTFNNLFLNGPKITGQGNIVVNTTAASGGNPIFVGGNIQANSLTLNTSKGDGIYLYEHDLTLDVEHLTINATANGFIQETSEPLAILTTPTTTTIDDTQSINVNSSGSWAFHNNSQAGVLNNVYMRSDKENSVINLMGANGYSHTSAGESILKADNINIGAWSYYGVYAGSGGLLEIEAKNDVNIKDKVNEEEKIGSYAQRAAKAENGTLKVIAKNGSTTMIGREEGVWTAGTGNATITSALNNKILAGKYGLHATGKDITVTGQNNIIGADNDVANNILDFNYGDGLAISSTNSTVTTVSATGENGYNAIYGAVSATGKDTTVGIGKLDVEGNTFSRISNGEVANSIYSAAVIDKAGGLTGKETTTDSETGETTTTGMDVVSALYAEKGGQIQLSGINTIQTYYADTTDEHTSERAVWAYDGAKIDIDGVTNISTYSYDQSPNSGDIAIAAGTATELTDEDFTDDVLNNLEKAKVNLNYKNGSSITGDILAAYGGEVNISNGAVQTRAAGEEAVVDGINIHGNLLAGNTGVLNVNLGNGGRLEGRADDYGDAGTEGLDSQHTSFFNPAFSSEILTGGEVNLAMGEGSKWTVTGQSWVTSVDTGNSEHVEIDLASAKSDLNANVQALTIGEMKGNAMFTMKLDGDRSASDMLYMKKANGEYFINLENAVTVEDMYQDGFDGLRFATVGKGSHATFSAGTYDDGVYNVEYEVGTDDYNGNRENGAYNSNSTGGDGQMTEAKPGNDLVDNLFKDEPQEAAAYGIMTLAAVDSPESPDSTEDMGTDTGMNGTTVDDTTNFKLIGVKSRELSDAGKTVVAMSQVNYANAIYMDRLNKRMGEARYIDGDEGLWVRIRHDRIGKSDAFRSKNTMMELGYDKRVDDREDGEHRRGFAIDYMRGTTDYHNVAGEGDVRRGGVWFYDTWLGNKGHYSDYVLKIGRLSNDFEIYARSTGEKITGDYSNFVYSASAEYGRKKDIGKDWYFEPQVQLQYAHVTDADYTTSQGTSVELDAIDSLIGRVGFRLGKDMGENNTFYIKADVLHEFLGDQDISTFDATGRLDTTYENEGTWYDVGLGLSHQFSKGTYMFLDVEKTFGNDNEDTYQFNVGMNWKV